MAVSIYALRKFAAGLLLAVVLIPANADAAPPQEGNLTSTAGSGATTTNGPAIPPMPVISEGAELVVYFDANSSVISADGLAIVQAAASNYQYEEQHGPYHIKLVVTGHSDRNEAKKPGRDMSKARARAVAKHLAKAGVPSERIEIKWVQDQQPCVASDEAERLNRFAYIGVETYLWLPKH